MSYTDQEVREALQAALEMVAEEHDLADDATLEPLTTAQGARSFQYAGVMTSDEGLVLTMGDGSEYQLTIIRSR